jgi:hypothetical protein
MPTRILFWNVRDFSINKINNPSLKRQQHSTITRTAASQDRLNQITTLINNVNPDIFVLVEVETVRNTPGTLVRGGGVTAAIQLLTAIRNTTNQPDWMLIPPIITGPKEGVAVYYRSTNRYFTGPNTWSGGANGFSQTPGTAPANNYPANLMNGLPNRTIPNASPNNPLTAERRVAAKIDYAYSEFAGIDRESDEVIFGKWRAPYMTTFAEFNGGFLQRKISLFSVHSPASYKSSGFYLQDLIYCEEIVSDPAANEVKVIAGDFNVNSMRTTDNYIPNPNYQNLIDVGYSLTIAPTHNVPNPINGYVGYFATHIKPAKHATYGSTFGAIQYYPGYGYMGADQGNFVAIDNIFVRYGAPAPVPVTTILNTIVGAPFLNPPPHTPAGVFPFQSFMGNFFGAAPPMQAPAYNAGVQTNFRGWNRYGRIYSVSDHFALLVDI